MQRALLPLLTAILVLAGCTVHEYPQGPNAGNPVVDLTLVLHLDKPLPEFQTVDFVSKAGFETTARYVVALYKYNGETCEETPTVALVRLEGGMSNQSYSVQVPNANYRVLAWVDYANSNGSSLYYDADSYTEVKLMGGTYAGGDPMRDAFCVAQDLPLTMLQSNRAAYTATLNLQRPNAYFKFIATDKDFFLKSLAGKASADISKYSVQISYPLFMPSTYSVMTGRATDSRTGVSFTVPMKMLADGTVDLGGDWVFASEEQNSVSVSLSFFDANGNLISSLDNLDIPVCPGKVTTVKGSLLTNGISNNGISINPGFDGEFVIEI